MRWRIVISRHPDAPPHHFLKVLLESSLLVMEPTSSDSIVKITFVVVNGYHWALHLKLRDLFKLEKKMVWLPH